MPQQPRKRQQRRSYSPRRQQLRRSNGGSWPAYLASTAGALIASVDALGYGGSLAFGSYASASKDKQLRSVGNGVLTGAGIATALALWVNRERLLERIGWA